MKPMTQTITRIPAIVAPTAIPATAPVLRPTLLAAMDVVAVIGEAVEITEERVDEGKLEAAAPVFAIEDDVVAIDSVS